MRRILISMSLIGLIAATTAAANRRTPVVVAVEKVAPAVVNISTEKRVTRQFESSDYHDEMDRFFGRFFPPRTQTMRSLGSGAIIDPDGFVVTNHHVVAAASKIQVTVMDGNGGEKVHEGRLINSDPRNDLALVKIDGGPFPYVDIAPADDLMIGETVIAVGNPIGLGHTVTTGVLSAKGRRIALSRSVRFEDLLQTDASINPGNSGGPLLDLDGRLIGVNTAIVRYSRGQSIQGIGFAIPAQRVREVLDDLLDYEKLGRISLGLDVEAVGNGARGVVIASVDATGPARDAGLRAGDRLLALGGAEVRSLFGFKKRILDRKEGDTLDLTVRRDDRTFTAKLVVAEIPVPEVVRLAWERLGTVVALPEESGLEKGIGVVGVRRDGPAHRIGVQQGDVLVDLGGRPLTTPADLTAALKAAPAGRPVRIRVWRRGSILTGSLELD